MSISKSLTLSNVAVEKAMCVTMGISTIDIDVLP
jgi:hypothetical protein